MNTGYLTGMLKNRKDGNMWRKITDMVGAVHTLLVVKCRLLLTAISVSSVALFFIYVS